MTASPQPVSTDATCPSPATAGEVDASCRAPVLLLFKSAIIWLVIGSALALIAAIKMHKGDILADLPWLTYGRIRAVSVNMFVYGFASQAAFGIGLWLLARLGRTPLIAPTIAVIGTMFWNLGVVLGIIGIFRGELSGYDMFDMPRYASAILFFSYLPIGVAAMLTFISRRQCELYVSSWFLFAALLFLPWLMATANLLLHVNPVRGAMQAVVAYWYANGIFSLWLAPVALATLFYFVPKLTDRALYSGPLAVLGFWFFILFAGWGGVPAGAALPAWLPTLSSVAAVLMIVPAVANGINLWVTRAGTTSKANFPLKFITVAGFAYVIGTIVAGIAAVRGVAYAVEFTLFANAVSQIALYGFVAMAFFGAIYYIVPQLTVQAWCPNRMRVHYLCSLIGTIAIVIGFAVGGIVQGGIQNNQNADFIDSVRRSVPFIGIATIGVLLLLAGHVAFFTNLAAVLWRQYAPCCGSNEKATTSEKVVVKKEKKGGRR